MAHKRIIIWPAVVCALLVAAGVYLQLDSAGLIEWPRGGWIVLVEESAQRNAEAAILLASDTWRQLPQQGWRVRTLDIDQAPARYRQRAEQVGLPAVLVMTPEGTEVSAWQLTDLADFKRRLRLD